MGSHRVGHDWATSLSLLTFMHWRRKWQPPPVFLPGESQGRGAWWLASLGSQSWTRLKRLSSSSQFVMQPRKTWVSLYFVERLTSMYDSIISSLCLYFVARLTSMYDSIISSFMMLVYQIYLLKWGLLCLNSYEILNSLKFLSLFFCNLFVKWSNT